MTNDAKQTTPAWKSWLANAGTSEGAKKGWETRRVGPWKAMADDIPKSFGRAGHEANWATSIADDAGDKARAEDTMRAHLKAFDEHLKAADSHAYAAKQPEATAEQKAEHLKMEAHHRKQYSAHHDASIEATKAGRSGYPKPTRPSFGNGSVGGRQIAQRMMWEGSNYHGPRW